MDGERLMKQTSLEEFVDLASHGTFVPVCKEIMADLLTPVSAFLKIAEHSDNAFLLESVAPNSRFMYECRSVLTKNK